MKNALSRITNFQKAVIALVLVIIFVVIFDISQSKSIEHPNVAGDQFENKIVEDTAEINEKKAETLEQELVPNDNAIENESVRVIQVFIDANKNSIFDPSEKACEVCVAKNVIITSMNSVYPDISSLKIASVKSMGSISESSLIGSNKIWGFFPDRKIFIPAQTILLGDGVEDQKYYAYEVSVSVNAENANLIKIESHGGAKLKLGFEQLIPTMIDAANNSLDIWVQVIPNLQNPDYYYITNGKLVSDSDFTQTPSGYSMVVDFKTEEDLSHIEKGQLNFFML